MTRIGSSDRGPIRGPLPRPQMPSNGRTARGRELRGRFSSDSRGDPRATTTVTGAYEGHSFLAQTSGRLLSQAQSRAASVQSKPCLSLA
ncbi:MAG: hypothetical protein JWN68_523 [Nocardioides sp.]|jgi:hypothetical protein|nr:hypothetical protein [Nocardioides sp.]